MTEESKGPREIEVTSDDVGRRLDRFLKSRFPKMPRGLLYKLLRERNVTVNRKKVKVDRTLEDGDRVQLWADLSGFAADPDRHLQYAHRVRSTLAFRRNFRILFEDDDLIILNKPAGLVIHPSKMHRKGDTLLDLLRAHLPDAFEKTSPFNPAFVHRLDRGTSGAVIAAKRHDAAKNLERMFRTREVEKIYVALCLGRIDADDGTIDDDIVQVADSSGVSRYRSAARGEGGSEARSVFRVEERFRDATLVEVRPDSGRTHQIRAHFAGVGHPLAGDGDYGRKSVNRNFREDFGLTRVFLHAAGLTFRHPCRDDEVSVRARLPRDLERVLQGLD
ncbi:MAG: RluA family pseudouridine synthase [Planctomycetota bacterium]